ncbi:patatin-like phospholipase family protein [Aliiroseovarius sp. F20344]|uniref:patatin-like phospholipase family protein n=1 Tax=Aliiroseovarius sp. F20344 TaxID=2926414 RepID=UPI001FF25CDB|nr:patatin-like phospholipase family protein [Aliiroseovarius sp. F20344]MCK0143857.1 patatin-like phospholipase family protein [Aliiroseovarius sp. F20344]
MRAIENRKPTIGLALGSGGARGWCHIGVLRALEELGIEPAVVSGCSMGALVGAAWAADRLDALEAWVLALTPGKYVGLMDVRLGSGGLVEAREIEVMLRNIGVPDRIEALPRPFGAVATDMETGREIWLQKGPTYPAVRGSVGIPGVFSPIQHEGHWLLDGGLSNPIPVSMARAMGAEVTIAVNPNAKPRGRFWKPPQPTQSAEAWAAAQLPPEWNQALGLDPDAKAEPGKPNYFEVLNATVDIMSDQIRRARLAGDPPHVLINMGFTNLTVLELHRGAEAITMGYARTMSQANQIREACA